MFTGIIDQLGIILDIQKHPAFYQLRIASPYSDLQKGESIAIDGVCLTVTSHDGGTFTCDISQETLKVTTLKNWHIQQQVNLERALQLSSRLGGHIVTGHVDQICTVSSIMKMGDFIEMAFTGLTAMGDKLVIKKGSIAINGVSLTINEVNGQGGFKVMLIPHTLEHTNLKSLREKDAVNVEFDMMARYIVERCERVEK